MKSPEIKRLQHRCFPVKSVKLLRTPFLQNTSGGVGVCLFKKFYIVGDFFSAAIFIKVLSYQSFDVKCLLLTWEVCVYRQAREW